MTGGRSSRSSAFPSYGISRDSPYSHVAWREVLDLDFPLLSDWNGEAVHGFGVGADFKGMTDVAVRSAFLVDGAGIIRGAWQLRENEVPDFGRAARSRARALRYVRAWLFLYAAAAVARDLAGGAVVSAPRSSPTAQPGYGEAAAGDHLQSVYRFWLARPPARAAVRRPGATLQLPAARRPAARARRAGPSGIPFWPLDALFGPVVAWNALLLAGIVAAGLLDVRLAARARRRAGPRPPSVGSRSRSPRTGSSRAAATCSAGSRSCCRSACLRSSARARRSPGASAQLWGALGRPRSCPMPLSGQVHLALGAVPFVLAYAARALPATAFAWTLAGAVAAVGVGLAIRYTVIAGSIEAGGRSLAEVELFQADVGRPSSTASPTGPRTSSPASGSSTRLARAAAGARRPRLPRPPAPHGWLAALLALAVARFRCCSRSGRTCRSTSRCGTRCPRFASRACPSGSCRSRASRSPGSPRSASPGSLLRRSVRRVAAAVAALRRAPRLRRPRSPAARARATADPANAGLRIASDPAAGRSSSRSSSRGSTSAAPTSTTRCRRRVSARAATRRSPPRPRSTTSFAATA